MKWYHRIALAVMLLVPGIACAKPLVADLSQYSIDIDSDFNGIRLLLFGSRNDTGDIIVVVRGPDKDFIVRKKQRVAGMWMNRKKQHFEGIPTYYAIASSKPFQDVHSSPLFAPLRIGLQQVINANGNGKNSFAPVLLNYEQLQHLYSPTPQKVSFMGESLFKLLIPFPDNIPRGDYSADVYLFNDGALTSMQSIPLHVDKTGFDAWVYDLAENHSVLYGLFAVLFAVIMGWGASAIMKKL
jgi:uncharacterized protein (TIGR02186 family)